ncbi:MAG: methylated-DNA--[protein]-cysteine S-methyltransferase [Chlorobiaceae bacterium]|nr:methylated-DNA--[protein]-cysteine S-methyltransferase [Chlorobiaceae bacterium]NTV61756.1 methylated-DNA--[protein]-cysteine S-methyltransferase [Chlorobiaceae bacterium]
MIYVQKTQVGRIGLEEHEGALTTLYFETDRVPPDSIVGETGFLREAFRQLEAYLAGELVFFTLNLAPSGTPFMMRIWELLDGIPYGREASYRQIAEASGNIRAVRAVGSACRRNPLPVFIPCHRVVGSDGHLTGYRGGLAIKHALLDLESRNRKKLCGED